MKGATKAVIALVFLVAVGAAYFLLSGPTGGTVYVDQVSVDTRSQNANLLAALYSGGIVDPLVDVTEERVYVAYDLPDGADPETMQRFVIGSAADTAPTSGQVMALQYVGGAPRLLWTVQMADFVALMNGQLANAEQFEAKVQKQSL